MMTMQKGTFETLQGARAIVMKMKQIGMHWRWLGAIEHPPTGVLVLCEWLPNGEHPTDKTLNLVVRK